MRILYGVQATGNGHITRARTMAPELRRAGVEVDWLFTGRDPARLFGMECFPGFRTLPGVTLKTDHGHLRYGKTLLRNPLARLWRDIRQLDLRGYDLVITDFEPVSAWAARRQGVPAVGVGHQYAFRYPVPMAGDNLGNRLVLQYFTPVVQALGVHWHHYDSPVLPPLIEPPPDEPTPGDPQRILVYMPFEDTSEVLAWLQRVEGYRFEVFCADARGYSSANCTLHSYDREAFREALYRCGGVIGNAGFGLASESIQAGRKLLVKPLGGQMEQVSNAYALEQLGYGTAISQFDNRTLLRWLHKPSRPPVRYPNVAAGIVEWLVDGRRTAPLGLALDLWGDVHASVSKTQRSAVASPISKAVL